MLLFCDSFDHYQTAQLPEKWTVTSTPTIVSPGRNGAGNCLEIPGASVAKNFPNQSQFIVGFALNPAGFYINTRVVVFSDNMGYTGSLVLNVAGGIEYHITVGDTTDTIVAASPCGIIQAGTFQYVEINVVFSPTNGSVSAQVNGQNVFSVTGVATVSGSNSYATTVALNNLGYNNYFFDDVYVCNGTGPYNNSFLGDVAAEALFPNAAGQSAEFSLFGGGVGLSPGI